MTEILETMMLVCFGISWPMSLIKNIKSGSAKSMSLQFNLMIVIGYLAGISAKIISGRVNWVIIIYIVNLLFVSANIPVFFINRKKDSDKMTVKENDR